MAQMVPLNKRSNKEQKEYHAKQRGSWYGLKTARRAPQFSKR